MTVSHTNKFRWYRTSFHHKYIADFDFTMADPYNTTDPEDFPNPDITTDADGGPDGTSDAPDAPDAPDGGAGAEEDTIGARKSILVL